MLVCVVGDAISKLFVRPRRLTLSNAFDVAQLSLAYGTAALFSHALHSAGGGWARLAALATGVLLVFFFVNTALVFAYLELGAHRAPGAAARDRPLPAHGSAPARPDRHPRGPRLRDLRARRNAPRVLPGGARLLRRAQPLLDGAPRRRGLPPEPRARRHARDLQRASAAAPASTDTSGCSPPSPGCFPVEAMAVIEWPGDDGEDFAVHVSERASASPGAILALGAAGNRVDERRVDRDSSPRSSRSARPAQIRLTAETHHQVRIRLSTFELHSGLLILESSSPPSIPPEAIASLRPIADHIALVLQDRAIRAQIEDLSERNRERAETLNQILEISNDLKKNRMIDDLFASIASAVAKSLGFREVVLSLYDREQQRLHAARAQRPRRPLGRDPPAGRPGRRDHPALDREEPGLQVLLSPRPLGAGDAPLARRRGRAEGRDGRRRRLAAGRASLDSPLRGGPAARLPLRRRAQDGASPTIETVRSLEIFANQAVSAIENARSYNEAREQSIRDSLTGRLQPPPFPGRPAARAGPRRARRQAPDGRHARHRRLQVDQRPLRPSRRRRDPPGHRRRDPQRGPRRHGRARPLRRRRVRPRPPGDAGSARPCSWPSASGGGWTSGSSGCPTPARSSVRRSRSGSRPTPRTRTRSRSWSRRRTRPSTGPSTAGKNAVVATSESGPGQLPLLPH